MVAQEVEHGNSDILRWLPGGVAAADNHDMLARAQPPAQGRTATACDPPTARADRVEKTAEAVDLANRRIKA